MQRGDVGRQGRLKPRDLAAERGDLTAQGRLKLREVSLRGEVLVRFFKSRDAFFD